MIEHRLLVPEQPVVTAVKLVDFRQPGILAQQIGQRAALKPLTMQAPFAARCQQTIGDQHEQHLIPMRPFAAHSQPLRPELIELQLAPQHQCQPARPHCRGRRRRNSDSLTPTTEASVSSPSTRSSGNSDSVRGRAAPSSKTSIDRRHANSCESLISPRYSTCRCTTRPPATRVFSTTLQERCCLPSFRRTLQRKNMMAANYRHIRGGENSLGRHYSRFSRISPTVLLADQSLAL